MLGPLIHLDVFIRDWVVTHRVAWLDTPLWLLSVVARGGALFIVAGAVIAIRRRRTRDFVQMVVAIVAASLLTNQMLKPLIARRRPFERTPAIHVIGGRPG